jgi:hypothetical protein
LILTLDQISKRYGVLPSELLCKGDSFDLMVFDVAVNWEMIQNAKANKKPVDPKLARRQFGDDMFKKAEEYYGHKDKS